ncbi:MAG: methionine gamma-lyase family protein [Lachnospiraceae bacterium]|nr:methionine gamma-lyase family protein [Lachnospiraceae bacterium]
MFHYPDIDDAIITKAAQIEEELKEIFHQIDEISEANQYKVLSAFIKHKVCEADFNSGSGYGYNEVGREKLESVYADIFHTEDALVRPQITCGTHALFLALSAILLPGDEILFLSGAPYDSLEKSIGITDSPGSLKEHGISYRIVPMLEGAQFDFEAIRSNIRENTKIAYIQRSKGYVNRPSLSCEQIKEAVDFVRSIRDDIILFVDNCYGEFVEDKEPTDSGADICVGSLIKNPGGGLAPMGGYIAGRADLIERCAFRLTAPGLGKEIGGALGTLKSFYQGLSLAPKVVSEALKNAHFLAAMCEAYGFHASPSSQDVHHCIVEAIDFYDPEKVIAFCRAIQHSSYVDSYVTPEPWEMPGYNDPVIMASGAFMNGSSIELSADGPLREPYTVYYQGGLTYEHGKYAILRALTEIMK